MLSERQGKKLMKRPLFMPMIAALAAMIVSAMAFAEPDTPNAIIDSAVNGVARGFAWWGWVARTVQTGEAQNYALGMTVGAVLILTAYLFL